MSHFGIISPPVPGHLNPLSALGRELQTRGHRVTVFHMPDLAEKVQSEGLEFWAIGQSDHPRGSLPASLARLGDRSGFAALRFTIDAVARTTTMMCRDGPEALRSAGVDVLLVDQMEPAGGSIAEYLGLPFVTICNALAINRDPMAPPPFSPWTYWDSPFAQWRNRLGYRISDWLTSPIAEAVAHYRREWNLPPQRVPDDSFSRLAQICQMPQAFDFPRRELPEYFHYVGPLRRPAITPIPFPWEALDGRPLIYASLGTLQNSREAVFRCIANACQDLDVQLVISHGGCLTPDQIAAFPAGPVLRGYVPQTELLPKAALTITHAGLNTVLDSLTFGVPVVAIPITYEQPAIARRIEWTGTGRSIEFRRLSPDILREAITDVLRDSGFRRAADRVSRDIANAGGVSRAADLVVKHAKV